MEATLEAVVREGRGKNEANRLRASGRIPAVVYGSGTAGTSVAVDPKMLSRILHSDSGANTLITLKLDDGEKRVMIREYQLDPITHHLLHADFYALAMDRVMTVTVPVQLVGEAPGVKIQGGIVDFVTRQIQVECLPADIPEHITVDISSLNLSQAVRVRDLPVNPKWTAAVDGDTMLVHIVALRAEEAPAAAEGGAAEPEVVKKGKTDKEGDEAKDKKK